MASAVEIVKPVTTDPRQFFIDQDWEVWFHEFATERQSRGGGYRYVSTFEFAKAKSSNRVIRDLILHVIGPVAAGKTPMYKDIPQYDWERRRKAGFWLGPEPLKDKIEAIVAQADTIDEVKSSARSALLPLLLQTAAMFDKIEAAFGGQIFLPNGTLKDNEARASLYMRLSDQAINGTIRIQEAYSRALGINMSDMQGTILFHEAAASRISGKSHELDGARSVIGKILEMTIDKGHTHGIPLPDPDMADIALKSSRG